jgi:hypothetical protein
LWVHQVYTDVIWLTVVEVPEIKWVIIFKLELTDDARLFESNLSDAVILVTEADRARAAVSSYTLVEREDTRLSVVTPLVVIEITGDLAEAEPLDRAIETELIGASTILWVFRGTEATACARLTIFIKEADVGRVTCTPVVGVYIAWDTIICVLLLTIGRVSDTVTKRYTFDNTREDTNRCGIRTVLLERITGA